MTPQEEQELFNVFLSQIDENFNRMTDAEAEEVVSAIKDATWKAQQQAHAKDIHNSSLDYALRGLKEEMRQKAMKDEQIELERTAEQRERERLDALEKARRVGESGLRYDSDGNSNQRVPESEEYKEFLNAWEKSRR